MPTPAQPGWAPAESGVVFHYDLHVLNNNSDIVGGFVKSSCRKYGVKTGLYIGIPREYQIQPAHFS